MDDIIAIILYLFFIIGLFIWLIINFKICLNSIIVRATIMDIYTIPGMPMVEMPRKYIKIEYNYENKLCYDTIQCGYILKTKFGKVIDILVYKKNNQIKTAILMETIIKIVSIVICLMCSFILLIVILFF